MKSSSETSHRVQGLFRTGPCVVRYRDGGNQADPRRLIVAWCERKGVPWSAWGEGVLVVEASASEVAEYIREMALESVDVEPAGGLFGGLRERVS